MLKKIIIYSLCVFLLSACKKDTSSPTTSDYDITLNLDEKVKDDELKIVCEKLIVSKCPKNVFCFAPDFVAINCKFTKRDSSRQHIFVLGSDNNNKTTFYDRTITLVSLTPNPLTTDAVVKKVTVLLKIE